MSRSDDIVLVDRRLFLFAFGWPLIAGPVVFASVAAGFLGGVIFAALVRAFL